MSNLQEQIASPEGERENQDNMSQMLGMADFRNIMYMSLRIESAMTYLFYTLVPVFIFNDVFRIRTRFFFSG